MTGRSSSRCWSPGSRAERLIIDGAHCMRAAPRLQRRSIAIARAWRRPASGRWMALSVAIFSDQKTGVPLALCSPPNGGPMRPSHLLLALLLPVAACDKPTVSSEATAADAYLGLDASIDKALQLGFTGFNTAQSAN